MADGVGHGGKYGNGNGHGIRCDCAQCNGEFRRHNLTTHCACYDCTCHREIRAPAPPTTTPETALKYRGGNVWEDQSGREIGLGRGYGASFDYGAVEYPQGYPQYIYDKINRNAQFGKVSNRDGFTIPKLIDAVSAYPPEVVERAKKMASINMCEREGCTALVKGNAVGLVQIRPNSSPQAQGRDNDLVKGYELCPPCVEDVDRILNTPPIMPRDKAYDKAYEGWKDATEEGDAVDKASAEQLAAALFEKLMKAAAGDKQKAIGAAVTGTEESFARRRNILLGEDEDED